MQLGQMDAMSNTDLVFTLRDKGMLAAAGPTSGLVVLCSVVDICCLQVFNNTTSDITRPVDTLDHRLDQKKTKKVSPAAPVIL